MGGSKAARELAGRAADRAAAGGGARRGAARPSSSPSRRRALPALDVPVWTEPDEPVAPAAGLVTALERAGAPGGRRRLRHAVRHGRAAARLAAAGGAARRRAARAVPGSLRGRRGCPRCARRSPPRRRCARRSRRLAPAALELVRLDPAGASTASNSARGAGGRGADVSAPTSCRRRRDRRLRARGVPGRGRRAGAALRARGDRRGRLRTQLRHPPAPARPGARAALRGVAGALRAARARLRVPARAGGCDRDLRDPEALDADYAAAPRASPTSAPSGWRARRWRPPSRRSPTGCAPTGWPPAARCRRAAATRAWAERARAAGAELGSASRARSRGDGGADAVVVAAGPWTAAALGAPLPVRALWGVVAQVRLPEPPRHPLEEAGVEALTAPGGAPAELFSIVTAGGVSAVGSTFTSRRSRTRPRSRPGCSRAALATCPRSRARAHRAGPRVRAAAVGRRATAARPRAGARARASADRPRRVGHLARAGVGAAGRRRAARPRRRRSPPSWRRRATSRWRRRRGRVVGGIPALL